MRKVGIVMGSKSDLPTVEKAISVLKEYGIETEVRVLSAHRCPDEAREFAYGGTPCRGFAGKHNFACNRYSLQERKL